MKGSNAKLRAALKAHATPVRYSGEHVERARKVEEAKGTAWGKATPQAMERDHKAQDVAERHGFPFRHPMRRTAKRKGTRRNFVEQYILNRIEEIS